MENPTEKKGFPWVWVAVGCGAVGVLAVAALAVMVLVGLPVIRSVIANQAPFVMTQVAPSIGSAPTLNPTAVPGLGSIPQAGPTAVPNPTTVPNTGSGKGTTIGDLPFKFSAVQDPTALSGQSLMDQMVSTLKLNTDTDFMAPKSYTGNAILDSSTSFTVGNGWCAKDSATLKQNLADMQFTLSINDVQIDLSKYPTIMTNDQQGNACAMTGIDIVPNGKLSGRYHVVLTQKFLKQLDDGITSSPYPAGDVKFDFNIEFQGTPLPGGTNT